MSNLWSRLLRHLPAAVFTRPCKNSYYYRRADVLSPSVQPADRAHPDRVLGVVMDYVCQRERRSLRVSRDGDSLLLLGAGTAVDGGLPSRAMQSLARDWLDLGQRLFECFEPSVQQLLPDPGEVRFWLLTPSGLRLAEAGERALRRGRHPLSPLYCKSQQILALLQADAQPAGPLRAAA